MGLHILGPEEVGFHRSRVEVVMELVGVVHMGLEEGVMVRVGVENGGELAVVGVVGNDSELVVVVVNCKCMVVGVENGSELVVVGEVNCICMAVGVMEMVGVCKQLVVEGMVMAVEATALRMVEVMVEEAEAVVVVLYKAVVVVEVLYKGMVMVVVANAVEVGTSIPVEVGEMSRCILVVEANMAVEVENVVLEVAVNYSSKGRVVEESTKVEEVVANLAVEAAVSAHNMVE